MGLKLEAGDSLRIEAEGPEARMALAQIAEAVEAGLTGDSEE